MSLFMLQSFGQWRLQRSETILGQRLSPVTFLEGWAEKRKLSGGICSTGPLVAHTNPVGPRYVYLCLQRLFLYFHCSWLLSLLSTVFHEVLLAFLPVSFYLLMRLVDVLSVLFSLQSKQCGSGSSTENGTAREKEMSIITNKRPLANSWVTV